MHQKQARALPYGLYYDPKFLKFDARNQILAWLSTIYPIWENRYSKNNPPPPGKEARRLLRPVYWLGNWQFACLNYYHPPHGILNRAVRAEAFPPALQTLVTRIEKITRKLFRPLDVPRKWHLNTCLVNLYGRKREGEKWIDTARVGEHKDFEPGPVASLSLGERAIFQFVKSRHIGQSDAVVFQQWLEDGSLQIFGGDRLKSQLFHRVQRVDRKGGFRFELNVNDFEVRRLNFTFRYVPDEHIVDFQKLPPKQKEDVREYVEKLARHSPFFQSVLT